MPPSAAQNRSSTTKTRERWVPPEARRHDKPLPSGSVRPLAVTPKTTFFISRNQPSASLPISTRLLPNFRDRPSAAAAIALEILDEALDFEINSLFNERSFELYWVDFVLLYSSENGEREQFKGLGIR